MRKWNIPVPQAYVENWIDMLNEFQKDTLSTRLGILIFYVIDDVHCPSSFKKNLFKKINNLFLLTILASELPGKFFV